MQHVNHVEADRGNVCITSVLQLDVLFPSSLELKNTLEGMESKHITGRTELFPLYETLTEPVSLDAKDSRCARSNPQA